MSSAWFAVVSGAGSGASQSFAFVASDLNGIDNSDVVEINFNTSSSVRAGGCLVQYSRSGNWVFLLDDAGTSYSGIALGSAGTLQNSQCTLNAAASSATVSGKDLTLTLALTFKTAFAGLRNVYMRGWNAGSYTDWQQRGTWDVMLCSLSLGSLSAPVGPGGGSGSVAVNYGAGQGFAITPASAARRAHAFGD